VPRKSVYLPEGLWEKVEPRATELERSVSWWFATAATEKLEREGRPEPPTVVKQYDENAKGTR
jgi:hypothetical protein